MDKQSIIKTVSAFVENSEFNIISKEAAISEKVLGMRIFDPPILGFASVSDEYFKLYKDPAVIGEHFLLPEEWLQGSKTVISFFLPFTQAVKKGNSRDMSWPSEEWLHGRIEGQAFINKLCSYMGSELEKGGCRAVIPSLDKRFWSKAGKDNQFTSNWSERHAAFVCGLGTFSLSKGLITRKGVAGRFGSIITELDLLPDKRNYESVYEYCSMCGACARNCPAAAISLEEGKNHRICSDFSNITFEKYKPRYGCGKCQVKVPCESCIPGK